MTDSTSGRAVGPQVRRRPRPGGTRSLAWTSGGLLAVVALTGGCGPATPAVTPAPASTTRTASATPAGTNGEAHDQGSLIATATVASIAVHAGPGGKVTRKLANPNSIGGPLTFMVLKDEPEWLKVALPLRPNGSTGWISRSDVATSRTTYRLVISRSKHRLDVMHDGRRTARYPVGVGKSVTPTPDGTYYLTELIQPPDPKGAYGPYAFGLSAYSNTLKTFAGGPGQLGLHGTDAPKGLGTDISHGCLRVENSVITDLAALLPLGTPVEIRA